MSTAADMDAMLQALRASGPDPKLRDRLMLFGQFVGSWDVEVVNIQPDGAEKRRSAEWHFGWVLQGRAIMDVWICPRRGDPSGDEPYEYGATIRFYDAELQAWRSTWIGPMRCAVRPFIAKQIGNEIVLEGSFSEGAITRWIFSELAGDGFRWRNVESSDGGRTWKQVQRMRAIRSNKG